MATGRIGVTPTLGTRWSKAPAGGTTSLSGLDDNSVSLVYSVGYEQVYRNGVLLSRGNDYTATTGNSITLIDATIAGDIIEVFANQLVPLTDAISKGQFTAKGALLSATAASTPAVLTVGSNNQVLTADSSTSTGLKWATPAGATASFTLLNTGGTTLTGSSVTVSGISNQETLLVRIVNVDTSTALVNIGMRVNGNTGNIYSQTGFSIVQTNNSATCDRYNQNNDDRLRLAVNDNAGATNAATVVISGAKGSGLKLVQTTGAGPTAASSVAYAAQGIIDDSNSITSITILVNSGTFDSGTVFVYGSAN